MIQADPFGFVSLVLGSYPSESLSPTLRSSATTLILIAWSRTNLTPLCRGGRVGCNSLVATAASSTAVSLWAHMVPRQDAEQVHTLMQSPPASHVFSLFLGLWHI